jgi:hypothetical protein
MLQQAAVQKKYFLPEARNKGCTLQKKRRKTNCVSASGFRGSRPDFGCLGRGAAAEIAHRHPGCLLSRGFGRGWPRH